MSEVSGAVDQVLLVTGRDAHGAAASLLLGVRRREAGGRAFLRQFEIAVRGVAETAAALLAAEAEQLRQKTAHLKALELERQHALKELPGFIKTMVGSYELRVYWFETFECMRKIALVGLPVFFPDGYEQERLMLGLICCFFSLGMYAWLAPFLSANANLVSLLCQLQIFFALLSGIVLLFPHSDDERVALGSLLGYLCLLTPTLSYLVSNSTVRSLYEKRAEHALRARRRYRQLVRRLIMPACCRRWLLRGDDSALVEASSANWAADDDAGRAAPQVWRRRSVLVPSATAGDGTGSASSTTGSALAIRSVGQITPPQQQSASPSLEAIAIELSPAADAAAPSSAAAAAGVAAQPQRGSADGPQLMPPGQLTHRAMLAGQRAREESTPGPRDSTCARHPSLGEALASGHDRVATAVAAIDGANDGQGPSKSSAAEDEEDTRTLKHAQRMHRKASLQAGDDFDDLHGHKDAPPTRLKHKAACTSHSLAADLAANKRAHAHDKLDGLKVHASGFGLAEGGRCRGNRANPGGWDSACVAKADADAAAAAAAATAAQPRRVSAGTVCLSTSVLGSLNAALAAPTPSEHADLSRDLSA